MDEFNWMKIENLQQAFALLFFNKFLADVKFQFSNNTIVYAHSFVLSIRSQICYGNFKGTIGTMKLIHVKNESCEIFKEFLKFLYTDELSLTMNNVRELLKLSITYKVYTLEEKCKYFIEQSTITENINRMEKSINKSSSFLCKTDKDLTDRKFEKMQLTRSDAINTSESSSEFNIIAAAKPSDVTENISFFTYLTTKDINKFDFTNQTQQEKFNKTDTICLQKNSSFITYKTTYKQETYFIEFRLSEMIILERIQLYINTKNVQIQYGLSSNGKILQTEEKFLNKTDALTKSSFNIRPIVLYPRKKYRLEYTFLNLPSLSSIAASKYQTDSEEIKQSNRYSIIFTVDRVNSHIAFMEFKCD